MKKTIVVFLLLAGVAFAGERVKSLYKVSRISPETFAVSCTDGAAPVVNGHIGNVILLTCSK